MQNKYNVILLVEGTPCAEIYNEEIEAFKQTLSHNVNVASVESFQFKNENNKIVIDDDCKELLTDNLVFVISSGTSAIWKNGEMYNTLEDLQSTALVNMVNLLPKKLWDKTGLDTYSHLITVSSEIKNNNNIINTLPYLISKAQFDNSLILPTTDINNANKLLSTIIDGGIVDNVVLYKGNQHIVSYNPTDTLNTNQEIKAYRALCSDNAFSLAMHLSVLDSFSMSDMKKVQEYMLPGTDKLVLAECMLGNIIEINSDNNYKIKDNIRQELRDTISLSKTHAIKLLMKELPAHQIDSKNDLEIKNQMRI